MDFSIGWGTKKTSRTRSVSLWHAKPVHVDKQDENTYAQSQFRGLPRGLNSFLLCTFGVLLLDLRTLCKRRANSGITLRARVTIQPCTRLVTAGPV